MPRRQRYTPRMNQDPLRHARETAEKLEGNLPNWWGTKQQVSPRLIQEVNLMRASFGTTFKLVMPARGNDLKWVGDITPNISNAPKVPHRVEITYGSNYPHHAPVARILSPHIGHSKHLLLGGALCLFNPSNGAQYGWNPATCTAVTIAGWAIQWIYAHYAYQATGKWVGDEETISNPDGRR